MRTEERNLLKKMIALFVFAQIMINVDGYLAYRLEYGIWGKILIRILLAIVMLYCVYKYIDKNIYVWSWKKCGYALTRLSPSLLWNVFLSIMLVMLSQGEFAMNEQALIMSMVGYVIRALTVSLYEEGLYRGIITGGLQHIVPQDKKGIWLTVLLSGAVFGVVHITSYIQIIKYNPGIVLFQMLTIFLQMGSVGILYAAVYIKTRNIWGGIVVHFLVDVIPFLASLTVSQSSGNVSVSGEVHVHMVQAQILMRIITTAILFIANMLITWRIITNMHKDNEEVIKKKSISVTTCSAVEE